jgi:hypothetical protein
MDRGTRDGRSVRTVAPFGGTRDVHRLRTTATLVVACAVLAVMVVLPVLAAG